MPRSDREFAVNPNLAGRLTSPVDSRARTELTKTIVCLASYEKGQAFMQECHAQGWRVVLVTGESLRDANWPREALQDIFFVPDPEKTWDLPALIRSIAYLARSIEIDRLVALDDFDVEKAAAVREHLRIPGMGDTTARNFRDKLAMRGRALDAGIAVPEFIGCINDAQVARYLAEVPAPWVLKPRFQANAIGIKKFDQPDAVWHAIHMLGDERSNYVLERFVAGTVAHVDSVVVNHEPIFAVASEYGTPPMEVFHGGRVFTSRTVQPGSEREMALLAINQQIMRGLGLREGVSHSEFILGEDGQLYFLETSARVGGAHIAEMVEAATGVNLWREWARLETAESLVGHQVKQERDHATALMNTLAKQEWPDMSMFDEPEVVWRLHRRQHAGLILASPSYDRVTELLVSFTQRFYAEFFASLPAADRASDIG